MRKNLLIAFFAFTSAVTILIAYMQKERADVCEARIHGLQQHMDEMTRRLDEQKRLAAEQQMHAARHAEFARRASILSK